MSSAYTRSVSLSCLNPSSWSRGLQMVMQPTNEDAKQSGTEGAALSEPNGWTLAVPSRSVRRCQQSTSGFGAVVTHARTHKVDGHSHRRRAVQLDTPLVFMHTCRIAGARLLGYSFRSQARAAILHPPCLRCQRLTARGFASAPGTNSSNGHSTQITSQISSTPCDNAGSILTELQMLQARQYVKLVLEQNTTMNLTGMSAVAKFAGARERPARHVNTECRCHQRG